MTVVTTVIPFLRLEGMSVEYRRALICYNIKNNEVKAVATTAFPNKRLEEMSVVTTDLT